jgi:hypothetical protein
MNKLNPENRDVILPQRQNQDNYYLNWFALKEIVVFLFFKDLSFYSFCTFITTNILLCFTNSFIKSWKSLGEHLMF